MLLGVGTHLPSPPPEAARHQKRKSQAGHTKKSTKAKKNDRSPLGVMANRPSNTEYPTAYLSPHTSIAGPSVSGRSSTSKSAAEHNMEKMDRALTEPTADSASDRPSAPVSRLPASFHAQHDISGEDATVGEMEIGYRRFELGVDGRGRLQPPSIRAEGGSFA